MDQVPWEQPQHRLENPREPSAGVLGVALELCAQISVILYFNCSSTGMQSWCLQSWCLQGCCGSCDSRHKGIQVPIRTDQGGTWVVRCLPSMDKALDSISSSS